MRHLVAGVGEHEGERRPPRAGAEDGDLVVLVHGFSCRSVLRGSPVSLTPALRGSKRSAGACSPRSSSTSAVIAAMIRSVAALITCWRARQGHQVVERHGRPGQHRDVLARERVRRLGVRRQQLLRAPLPDRDHRAPGLQGDPGGTGLAGHRPQVGVAGQRALGVDHDALAGAHRGDRGVVRALGVPAQPLDGDLAGARAGSSRAPCS